MRPLYYDRDISVCDEWRLYKVFLKDMGRIPKLGLTLDRIDNDLGYYAANCRWADNQVQAINRRQGNATRNLAVEKPPDG